jgi:hypothetical protein
MPRIVFGMVLVGLVLAARPLVAAAGNVKSLATPTGNSQAAPSSPPFRGFDPGGLQGFNPQPFQGFNPQGFSGFNPPTSPAVVPPLRHRRDAIVVIQPVFVDRSCWAPGYWTYQWVPQIYSSNVWVPGQWAPDGAWIESHYAIQSTSTGYYQELWVSERWLC